MPDPSPERLAEHTTLRLGGPARVVHATTEEALLDAVRSADAAGTPVLVLGGGSNLVVADEGLEGTVVRVETRGVAVDADACSGAMVTVAAGEPWDPFVALAVERGWVGVEALSGIPGSVGATPIQNVGAYGQEVADTVASVRCWDRVEGRQRTFFAGDCGFGYRTSRFKRDPGRYVVLAVAFQLRLGDLGEPVRYAELARVLGVEVGARVPAAAVRDAVLTLRRGKGMVLDAADHDTWSAGSFFTNPVLDPTAADRLPADAPRWRQPDGDHEDQRRLADRARRLHPRARQRPGRALGQAHAGAHQPWWREHRRPAGPGRRGPRRGRGAIRAAPRARARPGRLRAARARRPLSALTRDRRWVRSRWSWRTTW